MRMACVAVTLALLALASRQSLAQDCDCKWFKISSTSRGTVENCQERLQLTLVRIKLIVYDLIVYLKAQRCGFTKAGCRTFHQIVIFFNCTEMHKVMTAETSVHERIKNDSNQKKLNFQYRLYALNIFWKFHRPRKGIKRTDNKGWFFNVHVRCTHIYIAGLYPLSNFSLRKNWLNTRTVYNFQNVLTCIRYIRYRQIEFRSKAFPWVNARWKNVTVEISPNDLARNNNWLQLENVNL